MLTIGMGAEIRIANPEAVEAFNGTILAGCFEAIASGHHCISPQGMEFMSTVPTG